MKETEALLDQKCLALAKRDIELYGDRIPEQTQKDILEQRIRLGMSPYEAKLAGGAFQYRVELDTKHWAATSDPLKVMWAQSVSPDDSTHKDVIADDDPLQRETSATRDATASMPWD